jgi:hypothetical protein
MQLLQKLRDSSTIEEFTSEIFEIENKARVFSRKILDFLTQSRGNTILYSYTGYGYTPASLMYWYSLTFQSTKHPLLTEAEESSIYLLPYRDDLSILVFSTGEYSKLVATLQVARVLGVDYLAIAPEPPTDNLKSIAKFYGVEQVPLQGKVETALFATLASFFAISELYKSGLEARGRRLFTHGQEGFAVTARSFIEKYIDELDKIMKHDDIYITSTRFLEASAILLTHAIRELGKSAKYVPLEEAVNLDAPLLAVFLTTEERVRREFKALKHGSMIEFLLNVDPLEGIVYLTLLSYIIARSKDT